MSKKLDVLEKFKRTQHRFSKKYMHKKPWSDYVAGSRSGGAPLRIVVMLKCELPPTLHLPKTYYGYNVETEISGEFRAF